MGKIDDIFDDVVVNTKAAASVVSKKATEIFDNSKQKITAAELRGEINDKLRELGALTYKIKTQNIEAEEKVKALVEEIAGLKESLEIIYNNIASSKNMKKCPACNEDIPKNSVYCNICGEKI